MNTCASCAPSAAFRVAAKKPLSAYDGRFLRSAHGAAVLRSLAELGAMPDCHELEEPYYMGPDNEITSLSALRSGYESEIQEDPEMREYWEAEMDVHSFEDFMEYVTDMGGDFCEIPYFWAVFCGAGIVGNLTEDLEEACDLALPIAKECGAAVRLVFCYSA